MGESGTTNPRPSVNHGAPKGAKRPCADGTHNVYLHEVLDTWFEGTVKPRLTGRAFLIRYAPIVSRPNAQGRWV